MEISKEDFEALVDDAIDQVPDDLIAQVDNLVILVEDRNPARADLLGLYEGVPLTSRDSHYAGVLPDRIFIYRLPIAAICRTRAEIVEQVRITVIHEVGHYFGISDERLHELGWG
ncbi:metallopeptidase family protein [Parenemella sanctibonifatiensis]|uniref:Metallopeptidase family protein n=1 Tax=Parenemella sanctibonifatiensis TaxID=2016505 RepID=A0A255EAY6_9ACTN|nr:metallopeptidase family protein [Parenemella sanctibonifatiensis]OYN88686.1 hypothetical protein CGZ91_13715 [Parenemella sanctibonifatiensis]